MIDRKFGVLISLSCVFFVAACSNKGTITGGPVSTTPPSQTPPAPTPTTGSFITLSSDVGEWVGDGQSYAYTLADAEISVTAAGGLLEVDINGDENWNAEFQLPDTLTELEVGTYSNLTRYPFHDAAVGGLSWFGEGRGCNELTGAITINEVTYDAGALTTIDLEFEQYCDGDTLALRGRVSWDASDTTTPPGPVVAAPAGLWEPSGGAIPVADNYVYLASEAGDFIGDGGTYLYTNDTAIITVDETDGLLSVSVDGTEMWSGDFRAMNVISNVEAGYYPDLQRYPFHNPVKGGLSWSGEGRGCNTLTGWFVVDSVTYTGGSLSQIELRFEQHCEGGAPALNGKINWVQ